MAVELHLFEEGKAEAPHHGAFDRRRRRIDIDNKANVEGATFVDDEVANGNIVRSMEVTVSDSKLTIDVGIWDEYTMLNYLTIKSSGEQVTIFADGFESGDISAWASSGK